MDKKIFIGKWEAIAILVNLICVKAVLNFPRNMAEVAGNAGWLLAVYVSALTLAAYFIIQKLYSRFEGKDLLDIGEHIAGAAGRIVIGLFIMAVLLFTVSLYLRIFAEDMKIVAFTTSPISYITFFFVACMAIGAYLGIEAIARYHSIIVPVIILGYLLILAGVIPYVNLSNVLPLLGTGPKAIFMEGSLKTSIYMELIFLFLLIPFTKTYKTFRKVGFAAIGISAVFLVLTVLIYISVIPYPASVTRILPMYHLSRLINVGRFFQRIDAIFVLVWATAGIMYVTVGLFFITYLFKKTFGLKHYKPLILPFSAIIFTLSLIPESLIDASYLDLDITRNWGWIPALVMPIILLVIAGFIKRKPNTL